MREQDNNVLANRHNLGALIAFDATQIRLLQQTKFFFMLFLMLFVRVDIIMEEIT